jgi:hypothetical protein
MKLIASRGHVSSEADCFKGHWSTEADSFEVQGHMKLIAPIGLLLPVVASSKRSVAV